MVKTQKACLLPNSNVSVEIYEGFRKKRLFIAVRDLVFSYLYGAFPSL